MLCTHGRRGTNKGMGWAGLGARDKGSSSRQADTAHAFMQGGEEGRRRGAASGLSFRHGQSCPYRMVSIWSVVKEGCLLPNGPDDDPSWRPRLSGHPRCLACLPVQCPLDGPEEDGGWPWPAGTYCRTLLCRAVLTALVHGSVASL